LRFTKTNTHTATLFAKPTPLNIKLSSDRFAMFNKKRDIPHVTNALRFPITRRVAYQLGA